MVQLLQARILVLYIHMVKPKIIHGNNWQCYRTIPQRFANLAGLWHDSFRHPISERPYSLSGSNLSPASGLITITPPANFAVSATTGGPYSSAQITIGYRWHNRYDYLCCIPTTSSSTFYSGNISNSGGLAPAVDVAVSSSSTCGTLCIAHLMRVLTGRQYLIAGLKPKPGRASVIFGRFPRHPMPVVHLTEMVAASVNAIRTTRLISPALNTTGVTNLLVCRQAVL